MGFPLSLYEGSSERRSSTANKESKNDFKKENDRNSLSQSYLGDL